VEDSEPGISYDYDTGPFGKGRLASIVRSGSTIAYGSDRFGRLVQDGVLTYGYDANGNRTRMSYPNNVAAVYTHDFADREATLVFEQSGGSQPLAIVSSVTYESFGQLSSLTLGNGLTERASTGDPGAKFFIGRASPPSVDRRMVASYCLGKFSVSRISTDPPTSRMGHSCAIACAAASSATSIRKYPITDSFEPS
jgi:hypothetical protein